MEDALEFMQHLYTERWSEMHGWGSGGTTLDIIPRVRDPQVINGRLLAKLNRSTLYEYSQVAEHKPVAHLISFVDNVLVVMPRTAQSVLPSIETSKLSCQILLSSGPTLQKLLEEAGILREMTEEEQKQLRVGCVCEADRGRGRRHTDFVKFREALGITQDFECKGLVFSLAKYRELFVDLAYVVRDHPASVPDSWPFLRCTCTPFSLHGTCEHVEYARTLPVPGMKDLPNSGDNIAAPTRRGRPPGTHSTSQGKARAASRANAKAKTP